MSRIMGGIALDHAADKGVEGILRGELARSDRALDAVSPVLQHLLASEGPSLLNDAVVARVRGMLSDLAVQVLGHSAPSEALDQAANRFAEDASLLGHLHALALESQLTERFAHRLSLDPVLSPLLQELIASDDPMVATLAMNGLTAQARFMQSQRRMELPLSELPAHLFDKVLRLSEQHPSVSDKGAAERLRATYDESSTRLGLLSRLVSAMRAGAVASLAIDHAGLALFASGLAAFSQQRRDAAIAACHEQQGLRLALSLRAAGRDAAAIQRQLALIEPASFLTTDYSRITPQQAQQLLIQSASGGAI
jgi:hypothetical protein